MFGVAISVAVFGAGFTAAMTAVAALAFVGVLVALGMPRWRPAVTVRAPEPSSAAR